MDGSNVKRQILRFLKINCSTAGVALSVNYITVTITDKFNLIMHKTHLAALFVENDTTHVLLVITSKSLILFFHLQLTVDTIML